MSDNKKTNKITIFTTVTGLLTAGIVIGMIPVFAIRAQQRELKSQERFKGIEQYLNKNTFGTPLTMDIDASDPIKVEFKNFNEDERQDMKNAINELDEISQNLNYTILDNGNTHVEQKIVVQKIADEDLKEMLQKDNVGGHVDYTVDNLKAKITYPINIYISDICDNVMSETGNTSLLSYVLKHEMMHSLGFTDMYENKDIGTTIMYYSATENTVETFTDLDKSNIQQLYDYDIEKIVNDIKKGNIIVQGPSFLTDYYKEISKSKHKDNELEI